MFIWIYTNIIHTNSPLSVPAVWFPYERFRASGRANIRPGAVQGAAHDTAAAAGPPRPVPSTCYHGRGM